MKDIVEGLCTLFVEHGSSHDDAVFARTLKNLNESIQTAAETDRDQIFRLVCLGEEHDVFHLGYLPLETFRALSGTLQGNRYFGEFGVGFAKQGSHATYFLPRGIPRALFEWAIDTLTTADLKIQDVVMLSAGRNLPPSFLLDIGEWLLSEPRTRKLLVFRHRKRKLEQFSLDLRNTRNKFKRGGDGKSRLVWSGQRLSGSVYQSLVCVGRYAALVHYVTITSKHPEYLGCDECHAQPKAKLLVCAKCRVTRYCSKDCQKKNWKEKHKPVCKNLCKE